jgi:prepilin-type N-terminal cleavage/methylation domain-containing protein
MGKASLKNHRGFTMIELMVVLTILSIVMMAIYSVYRTHQRTAYTQDEVVEVQQNLRLGMGSITRDVRMAGFLIPYSTTPAPTPVISAIVNNNAGIAQPLPAPDNVNSDAVTITTASATDTVARIAQPPAGAKLYVDDPIAVDTFTIGDVVTIIRPGNRFQPAGAGIYSIGAKSKADPSITLAPSPSGIVIAGDLIVKTGTGGIGNYPNTITYCLGPSTLPAPNGCGNGVTTCPVGQLCLMRIFNLGQADMDSQPIAQNMAGLQISYLLDDGTEAPINTAIPADLSTIRAVRVTLIGQTITTAKLSDNSSKQRRLESIIMMRNR